DEEHEGDDQEVDSQGEETAPGQHGTLLFGVRQVVGGDRFGERREVIGEVEPAGDRADNGHDDVADQRIDDRTEGSTNDDADREVDDIALHRKFLEFLQHGEVLPATTGLFGGRDAAVS